MSKIRIVPVTKHGGSTCIVITELVEDLGWKPGDDVKLELNGKQLTVTLQEAA
jgi:antitoxin component of MazEF toxin-antitoxin module